VCAVKDDDSLFNEVSKIKLELPIETESNRKKISTQPSP
jgi:hypothetical protein